MKTLANLFLLTVLSLLLATAAFGSGEPVPMPTPHEGNDGAVECTDGKRDDKIYYTDCYARQGAEIAAFDDTGRLARALYDLAHDYEQSGKLIFNERAFYVKDQLNISSDTVLEGLGGGDLYGPTVIHFQGSSETLFFIGAGIHDVAIRDMGFYNESGSPANHNIAIRAEGYDSYAANASNFVFDRLTFDKFEKGFYVTATTDPRGWQFDVAQLTNSRFNDCLYAVHLKSDNANMELHNVQINSEAPEYDGKTLIHGAESGIWLERAGYVILKYVVGNGEPVEGVGAAGTFITIDRHGPILIDGVFGESFTKQLIVNGFDGYKFGTVTVTNSVFPACLEDGSYDEDDPMVLYDDAVVVSTGNTYGCFGVARPMITGKSEVYSTADRFCYDEPNPSDPSDCFEHTSGKRSQFVLKSNYAMLKSANAGIWDDLALPSFEIINTAYLATKPLLSLTSNTWDEGGTDNIYRTKYTFTRNSVNGRLEIEGDEYKPRTGYTFKNGPIQLTSVTYTQLITNSEYNISGDSGSLLYCSNCTAGTSPCTSSGSGALALRISGQWNCK